MEVQLSQNYTIADKSNKKLLDQSLCSSLEPQTLCGILASVSRCNYTLISSQTNSFQKRLRAKIPLANFTGPQESNPDSRD